MRALLQRVREASVSINGRLHSEISQGLLVFLGVGSADSTEDAKYLAERCATLRIFDDGNGKMNLSVKDVGGSMLVVSQFTLYADTRKGNRPSFTRAAAPEAAERIYNEFIAILSGYLDQGKVRTGLFRAMMNVSLVNDGPVTILLESEHDGE
jgi:D-tyrosyl-tRNA(Tyr) deacylase